MGNVGNDPRVRYVAENQAVASFPLATSERAFTRKDGTAVPERTEWHNIVMWGRDAEVAERYIRKGMLLYLEGHLRTRVWEDNTKVKRYVTEVYVDSFEILRRPGDHAGEHRDNGTAAAPES